MTLREEVNAQAQEVADWYIEEVKRLVEQMTEDGIPIFFEEEEPQPVPQEPE